uniref:THAP domain-containing protein 1 n=1 Tax=Neogobius melanostomus TaxID=47308 RepID=A0A8C6TCM0_9GOBI
MGRKCSVVGCHSTVGLHYFPQDLDFRRQWLRVIGLGESCELPPYAGVCKKHFARDSFANLMEFELGFAKKLLLKSEAVPTLVIFGRQVCRNYTDVWLFANITFFPQAT